MRFKLRAFSIFLLLLAAANLWSQQVSLLGLRSLNHAGAFRGLRQDGAGNLYTLFDAHDGVRLLKLSADGTQILAQTQIGQAGDSGIALALDNTGAIYVAGTSTSQGSIVGTTGTAFPNRSDSTTNSFVARFSPALALQWLSFVGSGKTAVTGIDATTSAVYLTGGIYAASLPVTSGGIQQSPAPGSNGNGFVEAFNTATGTLQYATYLTGANGDTQPTAIVADANGNTYITGSTSATGYPTTSALVPVMRSAGSNPVSGFVTKLNPTGDGFVFSTFVPGNGLVSAALDSSGSGSLLLSGNIAPGLFPLTIAQQPIASGMAYQSAVRLALDGSQVLSSTLLAPSSSSVITAGVSGQAWAFASSLDLPLLSLQPLETLGSSAAFRVDATGKVDRTTRIGGIPVNNSAYASLPVTEGGILVQSGGSVALTGSIAPTLSSSLLATEHYDLSLAQSPNAALNSVVRDALPLAGCNGSACYGTAGLLARLAPNASAPQLALSFDDHPNLVLRNHGTADVTGLQIAATGYTVTSGCGSTLAAGAECSIALNGTAAGSITVQAANFAAFTTQLPATASVANTVTVTPRELDFGIVTSATAANTRTLTIRNLGTAAQTFTSASINGIPAAYTLTEAASTCAVTGSDSTQKTVAGSGTCTVTLMLTPSASGGNDGAVAATWKIGNYDIPLTGYAQASVTSLSATTVDFGRQFVNGLRAPRYLYLSNASDAAQSHATVFSTNAVFSVTDECPLTLQPRSVCRIAITYQSATAPSSDALSLVVDGANVTLLGETLPQPSITGATANPNLSLSATSVTFADPVTVTTVSATVQTVTLSNSGASAFSLQMGLTGDFTSTTDCTSVLAAGASCRVNLSFTPSAPGTRQGLLAVTAGSAGPAYVTLSGTGTAILPQNNGIVFGDVPLNTPEVQWLKVQQALVSATASSSDASYKVVLVEDIGYGHGQPVASAFGASVTGSCLNCWLGIQFQPASVGADIAAISLGSAAAGKPTSVVVSGNGVPLSGVILTPLTQDFGPVAVHTGSASTVFQLTNGTASAITATAANVTGDFAATNEVTGGTSCVSATVQPGASCFIAVRFLPSATGTRFGQLTVQTSAGSASATLTGTGADDPGISFTPGELRFDNVPSASATQQTVTLTNTGSVPESVGTPASSDTHFTVSSGCSTLAAGASCTLTVTYAPTDSLSSGTLSIPVTTSPAGAASTSVYAIALTGQYTSETAGLQIIPGEHTTVNFGLAATGTLGPSRILHVNNLSGKSLALSISAPREFSVTSSNCGGLAPGGSCDLAVQLLPQTSGSITGTVFLQGTPSDGSATQNGLGYLEAYGQGRGSLAVTGNVSILGVLPFGQITSGQSASQTLTLTNPASTTAGTSITVRRIRSEAPFLTTTTCGQPLAPSQSCTVTVTYAPVYQVTGSTDLLPARSDTSSITIESDAANAPLFINMSGQAAPVTSSAAANSEALQTFSLSQGSLTFANTAVGSSSAAQSIVVSNTGTTTVHIQKVIASSGFSATPNNCAALTAGATCTLSVSYQPQATGSNSGTVEIQSDAVSSLEFVTLFGSGSAASVALSAQSIDFGRVLVGRSASQFVTLTNTGSTPVTLFGIATSGGDFALATSSTASNPCPATGTLPAGSSCTIAVVFTPSTAATIRGTLSVATSATSLPLTVDLSGVGTQPQLAVTPASLSFGKVTVSSSITLSLTLRNTSTSPVDGLAFAATQDFSVSNTCGATTLNGGSSCSVTVTYTPSSTGANSGSLTIGSTDPASPLVVPLTGTGIQPPATGGILLTVNGGSSASVTVQQGLSATYSLSVTPTNGYSGTVALTCTPDATVAYTACSVLPATLTLTNGAQSSTATITTVTAVATAQTQPSLSGKAVLACALPAGVLLLVSRRRKLSCTLLLCLVAFTVNGCGSGGDSRIRYASTGTYGFHVTAASTNGTTASQSVSLTLIIVPKNQS